jgi:hypothetical protein
MGAERQNISIPPHLQQRARAARINISAAAQDGIVAALAETNGQVPPGGIGDQAPAVDDHRLDRVEELLHRLSNGVAVVLLALGVLLMVHSVRVATSL